MSRRLHKRPVKVTVTAVLAQPRLTTDNASYDCQFCELSDDTALLDPSNQRRCRRCNARYYRVAGYRWRTGEKSHALMERDRVRKQS